MKKYKIIVTKNSVDKHVSCDGLSADEAIAKFDNLSVMETYDVMRLYESDGFNLNENKIVKETMLLNEASNYINYNDETAYTR